MLAGEPVTIAGFIDHGDPGPLDEVLVELANGKERTVRRDELTSVFDVIQGHWQTREVYLAGGRLNPSASLGTLRTGPNGPNVHIGKHQDPWGQAARPSTL